VTGDELPVPRWSRRTTRVMPVARAAESQEEVREREARGRGEGKPGPPEGGVMG